MGFWQSADYTEGGCDGRGCGGCSDCDPTLVAVCERCREEMDEPVVANDLKYCSTACAEADSTDDIAVACPTCKERFEALADAAGHACGSAS